MIWGTSMLFCAILLAVMLLIAAGFDLKSRIIPNWLNLLIALTAPLAWWAQGLSLWPDIGWQFGSAIAVFAVFAALFAIGGIGGGDVKMIAALALWIDARLILSLLLVMALVGGVIAGVMLLRQKLSKTAPNPEVPYGVAIAFAGFWALHQQFINHFPSIPAT
ncbi:MAG: prepilin peptidase [Sphingopyxis sp.]